MRDLILNIEGEGKLNFNLKAIINAGRTIKNPAELVSHVEELRKLGLNVDNEVPLFYPKIVDRIITGDKMQVLPNSKTQGEVEYVLIFDDDIFIGVGSDHTDRDLEKSDVCLSKQIYPNVLAPKLWRYSDVKDHWDDIIMRSWVKQDSKLILYQEDYLNTLIHPENLIKKFRSNFVKDLKGIIMFCGTLPLLKKDLKFGTYFEMELYDEYKNRSIKHTYSIEPIDWIVC